MLLDVPIVANAGIGNNWLEAGQKPYPPDHSPPFDHIIPKSKGGGSYYENYQLPCGACNRLKGDRPMEYLRMKRNKEEELLKDKIIFGEV